MQIPLRASGSSEIFPGTPRRPDQTQSHYWPYGQAGKLLTEERKGATEWEKGGKKERDRGGIFTTWTHTPHPQGESKLQSALQDRGGSQTGVHLKDEWERRRGAVRERTARKSARMCLWITVVNCEHCCLSHPPSRGIIFHPKRPRALTDLLYVLQSICILKKYICKCTPAGSPGWRRRLVWLDNHVPARDKEKVFCEKKTWAAVLHPDWPRRCSPCDWGQPGDSSLAS